MRAHAWRAFHDGNAAARDNNDNLDGVTTGAHTLSELHLVNKVRFHAEVAQAHVGYYAVLGGRLVCCGVGPAIGVTRKLAVNVKQLRFITSGRAPTILGHPICQPALRCLTRERFPQ